MGKKEKKSKKSRRRSDDGVKKGTCEDHHQKRCIGTTAIPISLGINIQTNNATSSFSWGEAFSAASTIRPNDDDLDEDFLLRSKTVDDANGEGGVGSIAELVRGYAPKESVHGTASDDGNGKCEELCDDECDLSVKSDDVSLEGRMMDLSPGGNKHSLVLVDKQNGKLYSSEARMPCGSRLIIGKIKKGIIKLDQDAIRKMKNMEHEDLGEQTSPGPSFPYRTNSDDHCETPLQSYQDILPILDELSKLRSGKKAKLRIYDPYFCDGLMIKHLESLGYTNVYNRKEDCYEIWASNKEPPFDVFITNPPYSDDHIEKLMKYLTSSNFGSKPYLLLMPQWVHKKDYYINATSGGGKERGKKRKRDNTNAQVTSPFYIVPKKRYVYLPPPDFREKKASDVHKKSSPFTSMWFIWGGTHDANEKLLNAFQRSNVKGCDVARSRSALRDLRRKGDKKKIKASKQS